MRALLPLLLIGSLGCAVAPTTQLQLRGNPRGPGDFEFTTTYWHEHAVGIEFIGYGFKTFYNSPLSWGYSPHYPSSGKVVLWIRATPLSSGNYRIMILGPSRTLGPGDDEVLTGTAAGNHLEKLQADGALRRLRLHDVPMQSRNLPELSFTLSGQIVAAHADARLFQRQIRQFDEELGYRTPPRKEDMFPYNQDPGARP